MGEQTRTQTRKTWFSHVAAGDSIQIDAYEPEEKILEGGNGEHNRRAGAIEDCPEEANIR
jgi:hypothetical protein